MDVLELRVDGLLSMVGEQQRVIEILCRRFDSLRDHNYVPPEGRSKIAKKPHKEGSRAEYMARWRKSKEAKKEGTPT